MKKKAAPGADSPVKKIWKDNVWGSVIAGLITTLLVSVGGYLLLGAVGVFAGEEVREHNATCTATGPNVHVREGQGLDYPTLFYVSKGEYFHIVENGKEDVVHDKPGRWKRIKYEGKKGWLFSAYMRCE